VAVEEVEVEEKEVVEEVVAMAKDMGMVQEVEGKEVAARTACNSRKCTPKRPIR